MEADPVTATKTIGLWCENQGLKCDINQSISKLQRVASQAFFGLGAQNKTYLESQIQKVFPEIFLNYYSFDTAFQAGAGMCGKMVASDYPSWAPHNVTFASCFLVSGTTDFVSDLKVLKQIIGKICPAHLEPIYQVEIKNLQATAQSGVWDVWDYASRQKLKKGEKNEEYSEPR